MENIYKKISLILIIPIVLVIITLINKNFVKSKLILGEDVYVNALSDKINKNEIDDIDYNFIKKDFDQVDIILKEQIAEPVDKKKKTNLYMIACDIYTNKLNELCRVLNDKLDDADFERLNNDIDEFNKNLDFALADIDSKIDSTIDSEYYKSKYQYEEKMNKCHELLETYKGFLIKKSS